MVHYLERLLGVNGLAMKMENMIGQAISTLKGNQYTLTELKYQGRLGAIYVESTGKYLVKIYDPTGDAQQDQLLENRIRHFMKAGMPPHFAAVLDIIAEPYTGYVLERVPDGYIPLSRFLGWGQDRPFAEWYNDYRGLRGRVFVGYMLAKAFGDLGRQGYSFCSFPEDSVFIRIDQNAGILMADIDSLYVASIVDHTITGESKYLAPEVVERLRNPDILSDSFTLASILYSLLRACPPDGMGVPEGEKQVDSGKALIDTELGSISSLAPSVVMTKRLEELFLKCFDGGKLGRMARPTPRDFEFALLDASNKLICCKSCGAWHFPRKDSTSKEFEPCPWCGAPSKPKYRLNFYNQLFIGGSVEQALDDTGDLRKLTNVYILRENDKNIIKNAYVMDLGTSNDGLIPSEDYMCFPCTSKGCFAYNPFGKEGIWVRAAADKKWRALGNNEQFQLHRFDMVFFTFGDEDKNTMVMDGDTYKYARMAVLVEEEA